MGERPGKIVGTSYILLWADTQHGAYHDSERLQQQEELVTPAEPVRRHLIAMAPVEPQSGPVVAVHMQSAESNAPGSALVLRELQEFLRQARAPPAWGHGDGLQVGHGLQASSLPDVIDADVANDITALIIHVAALREALDSNRCAANDVILAISIGNHAQTIVLDHLATLQHQVSLRIFVASPALQRGGIDWIEARLLRPKRDLLDSTALEALPITVHSGECRSLQDNRVQEVALEKHRGHLLDDLSGGEGVHLPELVRVGHRLQRDILRARSTSSPLR
mmetsp:Transcript_35802/g.92096  ORF Transcript_35802/g.92096 Transcript_35802/m.92096 type:complete len:280 (+) Transcript_35802:127-966(+)